MMLFETEEIIGAMTSMIEVDNSIYDAVLFESEVERAFAEAMSKREDIKLFIIDLFKIHDSRELQPYHPLQVEKEAHPHPSLPP